MKEVKMVKHTDETYVLQAKNKKGGADQNGEAVVEKEKKLANVW